MKVSLCARSAILTIAVPVKAFRFQIHEQPQEGSHVDLILDGDVSTLDVTICDMPYIIVDAQTASLLAGRTVDFDYNESEFIISKRGKE